jgi:hypothetical protein
MQHSIGCHHFARYLHDTVELSQLAGQLHVAEIVEAEESYGVLKWECSKMGHARPQ